MEVSGEVVEVKSIIEHENQYIEEIINLAYTKKKLQNLNLILTRILKQGKGSIKNTQTDLIHHLEKIPKTFRPPIAIANLIKIKQGLVSG